jgi:tight adherence protein B
MNTKKNSISIHDNQTNSNIACLPVAVMTLVYLTSPDYISLLWTHPTGRMMLAACALWMSMGVFVMRKMINFDF